MNTCLWIRLLRTETREPVYCGERVSFHYELDGDGNNKRKYNHFCEHHMAKAKEQDEQEEREGQS